MASVSGLQNILFIEGESKSQLRFSRSHSRWREGVKGSGRASGSGSALPCCNTSISGPLSASRIRNEPKPNPNCSPLLPPAIAFSYICARLTCLSPLMMEHDWLPLCGRARRESHDGGLPHCALKEAQLALRLCSVDAICIKLMSSSTDKQHKQTEGTAETQRRDATGQTDGQRSKLCGRSTSQKAQQEEEWEAETL